jgi:hypothetical protein
MKILTVIFALAAALFASGCTSIEKRVRSVPSFNFETWSHSDRYGVFTDSVTINGASWELNADGSATLKIAQYDGQAAWAGTVGPHDAFSKLVVIFPPMSPQAQTLARGIRPEIPSSIGIK